MISPLYLNREQRGVRSEEQDTPHREGLHHQFDQLKVSITLGEGRKKFGVKAFSENTSKRREGFARI